MVKLDLHCHSTTSDGLLGPKELIDRALAKQLSFFAITDHDTLEGAKSASGYARQLGLRLVMGVEFSTQWKGIGVHLIALDVDAGNLLLAEAVEKQMEARDRRAREIGHRLDKLGHHKGLVECYLQAKRLAGKAQIGRPHFAELLIRQGIARDAADAFKKYLGAGKAGDVKNQWLPLPDLIAAIHQAGGIAVLAHPGKYKMTATKLGCLLADFKEMGGDAMEVVSGPQNKDVTQYHAGLSRKFGLYASCGSDFHGPVSTWHDVGLVQPLPKECIPVTELFKGAA